jgi:hypothetical protein
MMNEPLSNNVDTGTSSSVRVNPTADNADLYEMPLLEYTPLMTNGELSLDAEATRDEKVDVENWSQAYEASPNTPSRQQPTNVPSPRDQEQGTGSELSTSPMHSMTLRPLGHYLTEPFTTANLAGVSECSLLRDRPAVWLVKGKSMALSPLAAAVLTREGLIGTKDLQL